MSFGISTYLIVRIFLFTLARRRISRSAPARAHFCARTFDTSTLLLIDIAHIVVYVPDCILYWIYSLTVVSPETLETELTLSIYRLADLCHEFTLFH